MTAKFTRFFLDADFNYDVPDMHDPVPIRWMNMVGAREGLSMTLGYAPDEGADAKGLLLKEVMLRLGGSENIVNYVKTQEGVFVTFRHMEPVK